jgi:hypothetical protein
MNFCSGGQLNLDPAQLVNDMYKLAGTDTTAETIMEHQQTLFIGLWNAGAMPTGDIAPHWVGIERSLLEHLKDEAFLKGLPFDVDNMLRMPAREGREAAYQLVLRPLRVCQ